MILVLLGNSVILNLLLTVNLPGSSKLSRSTVDPPDNDVS